MKKRTITILICLAVLTAGGAMLTFGIFRGEVETVFTKAVNICLECIGIG